MKKLIIMTIILASPLFVFCQKPVSVSEVTKKAYKYCNMEQVKVRGKVGGGVNILFAAYKLWDLKDSTYILVNPKTVSPNVGDTVVITGRLKEVFNFSGYRYLLLKEKGTTYDEVYKK